jgi:hypothetical protein
MKEEPCDMGRRWLETLVTMFAAHLMLTMHNFGSNCLNMLKLFLNILEALFPVKVKNL